MTFRPAHVHASRKRRTGSTAANTPRRSGATSSDVAGGRGQGHAFGDVRAHRAGDRGDGRQASYLQPPASGTTGPADLADVGIEIDDELILLPSWSITPMRAATLQRKNGAPVDACQVPATMRKVTSGTFEGGKTLDDYYPDLVGGDAWGSNNTAGPYDNGVRAGSAVQLIGEYPAVCLSGGTPFTLGQTATVNRMRGDGKKILEKGKPLEGQTLDDVKRSGRDATKAPFRQEFGFAVSMADPISGAPYSAFTTYEFSADLRSTLTGPGGTKAVTWGVTVESRKGAVTKNTVR